METTCGSLLSELQKIWDEVGEPESKKDKMLLELERECLEAYRRKVDQANQCRAQLRKAIADSEAEIAFISSAMGERPLHARKSAGSLKKELEAIMPVLEEMRKRKIERRSQFIEVIDQIKDISKEIHGSAENLQMVVINESDQSLKRLEELHVQLLALQKEKDDRLKQVLHDLNILDSLCMVLGVDFKQTITEIHPSLDDSVSTKNVSLKTMEKLSTTIQRLHAVKKQRLQQLQDLATTMVELWSLMDTPINEQHVFQNVTKNIAVSESEITELNSLSVDFINHAEAEVSRLQKIKASKIKDVILKKRSYLEELCRKAHMVLEEQSAAVYSVGTIDSGIVDPSYVLEHIELQISKIKEEAFSRKEILDKVEKWLAAREEECWLEEYNRDDNRYNAGRGSHLILKRAEKARAVVNKIPAMVEALTLKAMAWEKEKGVDFSYDGVRLLSMLESYAILRQEKEQERQRQRDQKKLQIQLLAEQEVLFGSKSSLLRSGKKAPRTSTGEAGSKRMSVGGVILQNSITGKASLSACPIKKTSSLKQENTRNHQHSGNQIPDTGGFQAKQQTCNTPNPHETKSPVIIRKPLSPVNSPLLSRASTAIIQDQSIAENAASQKPLTTNRTPMASPAKLVSASDIENQTPRAMPIPLPDTPPTVTMQTTTTPATPCVPCGADFVEYSFEERRAGLVPPKSYVRPVLQH
ncbi:65-kDa microtubule-associated protein 3-like [Diospyros lotus]|uniref:65-kDa microtubule-associated protein 3-like n=1 Tax=Diospyros lotus TaxID=55363 RepID=UPI002250452F|nr:65-kDa microtubule-associated protein 3-like [Diospyros lotus]XP_052211041.1 65-kDa microtubule-associated protein 3-like [Diospyros lotus]XP_052211042.1 65-kDa microtubule-associated protein 3-like [Diospyros lotus]